MHQFVLDEHTEQYRLINMDANDDVAAPQWFPDCRIDLHNIFELADENSD